MVFKASMLDCRRAICHGYMCIVLYMKLIWCNGFAEIYARLEGGNLCGVMVLQRSMLNWRGSIWHRYICIVLYIYRSAIRCAKFGAAVLKASMLDWGVSICHGYMCIMLYMKLIWCNAFAEIYARSAMRCAKCGVAVLKASMFDWGCQSAMGICALCYIWNLFGVKGLQRSMLNWRGRSALCYIC